MEARDGWLACLQYAASQEDDIGIVGARLLYPDDRIQFAGTVRNLGAPEWFDHRYRFKPDDWGPAGLSSPGAGGDGRLHVRASRGDRAGRPARRALPDGLRGRRLVPARLAGRISACSTSPPRASTTTSRSRAAPRSASASASSQRAVLGAVGGVLRRARRAHGRGKLRVVYVTEDTGVGGGHRDIFEHLNRLAERGHEVALYTLGEQPDWFELQRAGAQLRVLRGTGRGARRAGRDQGRDLVEHRRAGVAGERAARHPRLLRPGHRDELLPRRRAHAPRRARLLSPRVPLHDDLLVEPRAAARAGPRRRADPAGDRPRDLPPAARTSRAARTWCSRSGARTR